MMKSLLLLLLLPILSFSQQKKSKPYYIAGSFGTEIPEGGGTGFSASVSAGPNIKNATFIGIGAGFTKFRDIRGTFIPLFLNLDFAPSKSHIGPVIIFQPGYGIYHNKYWERNIPFTTSGGFTFYGAGGIGFRGSRSVGQLTFGYATYARKVYDYSYFVNSLSIRFTLTSFN